MADKINLLVRLSGEFKRSLLNSRQFRSLFTTVKTSHPTSRWEERTDSFATYNHVRVRTSRRNVSKVTRHEVSWGHVIKRLKFGLVDGMQLFF